MFLSFEFGMVEGGDKSDHELRRKTPLRCPSRIAGVSVQSPCSNSGALCREFNAANGQLSSPGPGNAVPRLSRCVDDGRHIHRLCTIRAPTEATAYMCERSISASFTPMHRTEP